MKQADSNADTHPEGSELSKRERGGLGYPRGESKKGFLEEVVMCLAAGLLIRSGKPLWRGFPVALVVKKLPADGGDAGLIPGSGSSPGGGNGYPLQYFYLGNPMGRGAWWATVHGAVKSQT